VRKSLLTFLSILALPFTIAQAGVGWQLTFGTEGAVLQPPRSL
jgi:hypothetical protein